jgi:hypothetical protein
MEQAFDNVLLPTACENQSNLYLRVVVTADISIGGANAIISSTSGDASINNVAITGSSTAIVTSLEAPEISSTATTEDTSAIFDTDSIVIADTNGGADVYYSVDGSEAQLYTESFNPFDSSTAKLGDKVTVTAWAQFDKIQSEVTTATFTFAGVNINTFAYDSYSTNVSNGAVFSTDGAYGESGKMTAYTDESGQYVPLWISKNSAYSISPDDGMVWTENSGFTFETSTAGYKNVTFTAKAYTTAQGPNSVQLQYSINGTDWVAVSDNVQLNANGSLDQAFMTVSLPSECDNQAKLYVRLATVENKTHGSDTTASAKLHNNASKGNFYINNVVIGGEDNGTYKMPYTNKTSSYFGGSGVIEYTNADSVAMQYAVTNPDGEVISSGAYPSTGISIGTMEKFDSTVAGPYTVSIWAGDEDDKSIVNTRQYYYKGTTITKFKYNDTTKSITNYLNSDSTVATNTGGANAGTLSMYPNGETATTLSYTGTYGVKVSWAEDNTFVASKKLDKPKDNGYWLITTSTKGYSNVTLNLDQLSSNKGPRDWGLAYSLDGTNYTYIAQSNVRAISNDAVDSAVETYNNFALPSECDNQEQIYIKVFINGGESVDGSELETLLKGNTGIDNIELNGVALPTTATVTFNPVVLENVTDTTGTVGVDATVTINGVDYETNQSTVAVELVEGKRYTASVSVNGTFAHQITFTAKDGDSYDVTVVAIDKNGDGIVNAKDFAMIYNLVKDSELKKYYINVFHNFINVEQEYFSYAN